MKFLILIQSSPQIYPLGGLSAYYFSKALLKKGHEILQLFFYLDGIEHAYAPSKKPSWETLSVPLMFCQTAARHRRLLTAKSRFTCFQPSSLTQFFSALAKTDHCVSF